MMCREKSYGIGSVVKVKNCPGGPQLPVGLYPGLEVVVVGIDIGSRTVEYNDWRWDVAMTNIDAGMEYVTSTLTP